MSETMTHCKQQYPDQKIQMSAQYHLQAFYQNFGFSCVGDAYDEDGIPHITMLYNPADRNK